MKCPECGNTKEFLASQACRGTVTVIVDGEGNFLGNPNNWFDESGLDFDEPEGPYQCSKCRYEIEEDDDT